ncbi:hypothetical protein AL532_15490 [Pseudomonas monteilii]|uniref:Uncharacterized protein n=1 Tax=Pseudomonas kurunegalensis TaxID=485880 RepID=A0ACC5UQR3_9PSED|nr:MULTISPECIES: hypothetical protein [Pseudomonas]AVH37641.1 hypothetical protein AL532_15490 [Pseudomonas monteilii]MBV4516793.1 hypothetical protein [Pseudomonas kurunegalensis]MBZ3662328.1 hypothetical protein [Pseudomonas monteilii]MBZ3667654.1 hypothetical protein [Pseudomonas monteilii]BBV98302.1 hypothetical protein STW0522PSE72_36530 [Pseudomonas monteilii]
MNSLDAIFAALSSWKVLYGRRILIIGASGFIGVIPLGQMGEAEAVINEARKMAPIDYLKSAVNGN